LTLTSLGESGKSKKHFLGVRVRSPLQNTTTNNQPTNRNLSNSAEDSKQTLVEQSEGIIQARELK
jgi:hypothetical protein